MRATCPRCGSHPQIFVRYLDDLVCLPCRDGNGEPSLLSRRLPFLYKPLPPKAMWLLVVCLIAGTVVDAL